MMIDQGDGFPQFVRRHSAVSDLYIPQRTVPPYELDRESGGEGIGVEPPDDVGFIQFMQERHGDVADMLVAETDLR